MNYCLGFLTDPTGERILLMEKRRPHWQVGLLNGIGGKLEDEESGVEAMARECVEETGLDVNQWFALDTLTFPGGQVEVFHAVADLDRARTTTDEPLRVIPLVEALSAPEKLVESVYGFLRQVQGRIPASPSPRRVHP